VIDLQEDSESDDDMPGVGEKSMPPKTYEDENVTDDESDLELDNEGVVEPDDEPPQKASRPYRNTLLFITISSRFLVQCDCALMFFWLDCEAILKFRRVVWSLLSSECSCARLDSIRHGHESQAPQGDLLKAGALFFHMLFMNVVWVLMHRDVVSINESSLLHTSAFVVCDAKIGMEFALKLIFTLGLL